MIYIIGVGGGGSWLAHVMARLGSPRSITLVDGDTLEEKNLDRQLFSEDDIGKNKAAALAKRLDTLYSDKWYDEYLFTHEPTDWLFGCVDNNPGRLAVLKACDMYDCKAIIPANETHSSEAYVYLPEWRGTRLDPRVYYPEIVEDETGSPARRAMGCIEKIKESGNVQLVTANFMSAALASHMFVIWGMEYRSSTELARSYFPHRLRQNLTRNEFTLAGKLEPEKVSE